MRIGTIHAFCQSLLRRFPLEAQLAPHFVLVDDADAALAWQAAQEEVLAGALEPARAGALQTLAGLISLEQFRKIVTDLGAEARPPECRRRRADPMRLPACSAPSRTRTPAAAARSRWAGEALICDAARCVAAQGAAKASATATDMLDWLALPAATRAETWEQWRDLFLRPDGTARGLGALISPKLQQQRPDVVEALLAEQARVLAVEDARRAARTLAVSVALISLAAPLVRRVRRCRSSAPGCSTTTT